MNEKIDDIDKIALYWLDSADKNYVTMQHLFTSKDYSWSLFLGHLVLEKILKALFVKRFGKHAIFSHDLLLLAKKVGLDFDDELEEWLDVITTFNLNARYDNYKQDFHQLCTPEFTTLWQERIEKVRRWLISQL